MTPLTDFSKVDWTWIVKLISLGIIVPLSISAIYVWAITHPDWIDWAIEKELIYVDIVKLMSIGYLAFHTRSSVSVLSITSRLPMNVYDPPKIWMYVATGALCIHFPIMIFASVPTEHTFIKIVYSFVSSEGCLLFIDILAFLYMFIFLYENRQLIKKRSNDRGALLFARAFIFGVNLPSIVAFVLLLFIYAFIRNTFKHPDIFLAGCLSFLTYSSTAASICVDHYVRPFVSCKL